MEQASVSPEDLVQLRDSVEEWTKRARGAVQSFLRADGAFWKDSAAYADAKKADKNPEKKPPNLTSTARSYAALLAADRAVTPDVPDDWASSFERFIDSPRIIWRKRGLFEVPLARKKADSLDPGALNNFDVAHLADFVLTSDYLKRYYDRASKPLYAMIKGGKRGEALRPRVAKILTTALDECAEIQPGGQVLFEPGQQESKHFFATLHVLRALEIMEHRPKLDLVRKLSEAARSFCVEQGYYFQRGTRHRQDPVRLVFAGCIYALYEEHIDKDLCVAIIEALAQSQQENGSWPATHPVFRKKMQPWHIASHEVALCLSWLYFQPKIPNAARPLLLQMMQKYFLRSVVPTFVKSTTAGKEFQGWQDDHTVSSDTTVGWATAIVCHFLSNYVDVLRDWTNRQVVESLKLQQVTEHYLIDDTASDKSRSLRWKSDSAAPLWPDVPPQAWKRDYEFEPNSIRREITKRWSDPSPKGDDTRLLAEKILAPIFENPREFPNRKGCSGLLPGEPGTRKTTLVRQIAEVLKWPMVTVPASLIFEKGFDLMESQGHDVFRRLTYLRRCVIFFDEFEEFFVLRDKDKKEADHHSANVVGAGSAASKTKTAVGTSSVVTKSAGENTDAARSSLMASKPGDAAAKATPDPPRGRTIADFTTSAMLPRLQELHDQVGCLIFLATNHPEKLDEAITRPGRFDFQIEIKHPSKTRLRQYLRSPTVTLLKTLKVKTSSDPVYRKARDLVGSLLKEQSETEISFLVAETALAVAITALRKKTPMHSVRQTARLSLKNGLDAFKSKAPPKLQDFVL